VKKLVHSTPTNAETKVCFETNGIYIVRHLLFHVALTRKSLFGDFESSERFSAKL
jgi:hypothetical protein